MEKDQVEAVSKMQDYIENHINENITLLELSKAAGYSPWHSARIFKEYTGKTPFEYIRALRLTKAALVLRDEKIRVLDVALDFMFDSHEGFARAFSKEFGISPKKYSKSSPPVKLFLPHAVRDYYKYLERSAKSMEKKTNTTSIFVQVMERPKRKLIVKRGIKAKDYFEYCDEVGCDVWGILTSIKDALNEPMGLWLPDSMIKEGTSKYVQGVEVSVDYDGLIPDGFDMIDLPPCKMMVFQSQPYDDEEFMSVIGSVWETISTYNPKLYGFEWAENDGPRFQFEPQGFRGYIEGRPVKAL